MTDSQISKLEEKPMAEIMTTSCPSSSMMNCGCRNCLLMHRGMQIYPIPIGSLNTTFIFQKLTFQLSFNVNHNI